jgi:sterol desaturase/sphingolipid hydroxylase (fatty acid hydroxylase superfamily)/rhodanese-related sulfurtransferase
LKIPATRTIKLLIISLFLIVGFLALIVPRRYSMNSLLAKIDRQFPNVAQMTTGDLARRLEAEQVVPLYDVRTPEEYEASHLPGAFLLEPETLAIEAVRRLKAEHTNRAVVLYCSVGYRAAQMSEALSAAGWTNSVVLRGSIFQWALEGRPLESDKPGTPLVHPHSFSYTHLVPAEKRLALPGSTLIMNHLPRAEKIRLAIGFALLVLFLVWETIAPAYRWFRNPAARLGHGWRNYLLGFINAILAGLFFVQLWLLAAKWADQNDFGLMNLLSIEGWARIAFAVLLLDAWTYGWHRLNHHWRFLWRFHRTHHTEMQMDVTSAVRFHFGEIVMSGLLRVPLILLLGLQFKELLIYETLLFATVQFQHANIRLPARIESILSLFIASPAFHRVHHSTDVRLSNSNYSSLLTIWDRIFRTRSANLIPAGTPGTFGVSGMDSPDQHTLLGLVESPLE